MKNGYFLADANIGLRILVGKTDLKNAKTEKEIMQRQKMINEMMLLLQEVDRGDKELEFTDATIEEIVYVLQGIYKVNRDIIASSILVLLGVPRIHSSVLIRDTLRAYGQGKLDINDFKLALESKRRGIPVLTYDKGFKHADCEFYSPSELLSSKNGREADDHE